MLVENERQVQRGSPSMSLAERVQRALASG
jgi:hypothetical protein